MTTEGAQRLLVCGGRDFSERAYLFRVLDEVAASRPVALLIEGGAPGADALARGWAILRSVPVHTYRAEWAKHGRAAGPKRNQLMLDDGKPDVVVAFPGGAGTADMVRRAEAAGVAVLKGLKP